jgi:hypothetical protein
MIIAQSFFIGTVLSHFSLLRCSSIPLAKGAQSFLDATVLGHFLLLQYSVIFHCCSTRPFPVLQYSTIPRYNSAQGSLVILQNDRVRSRVTRGSVMGARDRAALGVGSRGTELCRAWIGRLVRWLGQVMDHGSITLSDK